MDPMTPKVDAADREPSGRLEALRRYGILDAPSEIPFDDLATLAAHLCDAPIALVGFVAGNREWFKARVGLSIDAVPREISFSAHAILQPEVFVVPDASIDPHFADNPLVTGAPRIRFYAGAPIETRDGHRLGAIGVMDHVARQPTESQLRGLRALANHALTLLELRRASLRDSAAQPAEELLQAVTRGTATVTGTKFFSSLVEHLAHALKVRRVYVAECLDNDRARTRALWMDGFRPTFEYDLRDTPCMKVAEGETCLYSHNVREYFPHIDLLAQLNAESFVGVPLWDSSHRVIGHMVLVDDKPMSEDPLWISVLQTFATRAGAELEREQADEKLREALTQVEILTSRLQAENVYLQEEIRTEHNFEEMVGQSPALVAVLRKVDRIAATDATVLVTGETGTGKELIARALHSRSARKHRPLVKVNCGAVPASLIESELFGHVKGAFTGAIDRRVGRFELADGGTLFLDEVSELVLDTQVKLLRVLQEQEFEPVGSSRTLRVDVRIIAATNRDLAEQVRLGQFRSDLYFRLNVIPLTVPPLRKRPEDIPPLVTYFVSRFAKKFGRKIDAVSRDTMNLLIRYPWPGNVRELQNVVERAVVLASGPLLKVDAELLPIGEVSAAAAQDPSIPDAQPMSMRDAERQHIEAVLRQTKGVIEGPDGAARILDINPNTLRNRMRKLGVVGKGRQTSQPRS
jgi:transcriptional regulator with GAF, ATPase, and Fis domain